MQFSKQNYTPLQKGCPNYSRWSTWYATDTSCQNDNSRSAL